MSLTVNLYYTGKNGSARKFAEDNPEVVKFLLKRNNKEF